MSSSWRACTDGGSWDSGPAGCAMTGRPTGSRKRWPSAYSRVGPREPGRAMGRLGGDPGPVPLVRLGYRGVAVAIRRGSPVRAGLPAAHAATGPLRAGARAAGSHPDTADRDRRDGNRGDPRAAGWISPGAKRVAAMALLHRPLD